MNFLRLPFDFWIYKIQNIKNSDNETSFASTWEEHRCHKMARDKILFKLNVRRVSIGSLPNTDY